MFVQNVCISAPTNIIEDVFTSWCKIVGGVQFFQGCKKDYLGLCVLGQYLYINMLQTSV